MIGVQFNIDNETYEAISAPVLDGENDLVIVAVGAKSGKVCTIKVDDIDELNRPPQMMNQNQH